MPEPLTAERIDRASGHFARYLIAELRALAALAREVRCLDIPRYVAGTGSANLTMDPCGTCAGCRVRAAGERLRDA